MKTEIELTHTVSLDKDFFKFLKQKGCLEQYFNNLKGRKKTVEAVKSFFESQDVFCSVLNSAFSWDSSPEGYKFWAGIAEEWRKLCYPEWCRGNCRVKVRWVDLEAWTKAFEGDLLAGKRYIVRDNSWNRPALGMWQDGVWNFFDLESNTGWINVVGLCPAEGVLILSDYPVEKFLVNGPAKQTSSQKFVKVLLPDGRVWWVIYNENCVL